MKKERKKERDRGREEKRWRMMEDECEEREVDGTRKRISKRKNEKTENTIHF